MINSTIARNLAVAHVGGGIWARGDLYVGNSTVTDNYAEGKGGGVFAAGVVTLANATIADNIAPVAANVGAGERLESFGSAIGPAKLDGNGGQAQPTDENCEVPSAVSLGFNAVTDATCDLHGGTDFLIGPVFASGLGNPLTDRIPADRCLDPPLPAQLEGEQHLDGLVGDLRALFATDQHGVPRPQGAACDAGAVEAVR